VVWKKLTLDKVTYVVGFYYKKGVHTGYVLGFLNIFSKRFKEDSVPLCL
jgi:hypothetical protein